MAADRVAAIPDRPAALAAEPPPGLEALVAAVLVTAVEGFVFGVVAAFLVPAGPRVGGVLLSVGVGMAVVGVALLARFAAWVGGERLVGLAPVTGFLAAATLAQHLWHGGVVLPTASGAPDWLATYLFLLGGALSGGLAVALPARSRSRSRSTPP